MNMLALLGEEGASRTCSVAPDAGSHRRKETVRIKLSREDCDENGSQLVKVEADSLNRTVLMHTYKVRYFLT